MDIHTNNQRALDDLYAFTIANGHITFLTERAEFWDLGDGVSISWHGVPNFIYAIISVNGKGFEVR